MKNVDVFNQTDTSFRQVLSRGPHLLSDQSRKRFSNSIAPNQSNYSANSGLSGYGSFKKNDKPSKISLNSTSNRKLPDTNQDYEPNWTNKNLSQAQNLNQTGNLESKESIKKIKEQNAIKNLKEKGLEFFGVNYDEYIEFTKILERKKVEPSEKEL